MLINKQEYVLNYFFNNNLIFLSANDIVVLFFLFFFQYQHYFSIILYRYIFCITAYIKGVSLYFLFS